MVDAHGRYRTGPEAERLLDDPKRQEPIPGRDLRLTIDIELMQAIERAMRPHAAGAAVVVDVRTGRILAAYSKPDFDPERSQRRRRKAARPRDVRAPLERPAPADARQDDERRVPTGLDVQAVLRARGASRTRSSTPRRRSAATAT